MWLSSAYLTLLATLFSTTHANTEKIIFTAPAVSALPDSKPGTDFLKITSLTHQHRSLSTGLQVTFPTQDHPGTDHWYLLRELHERQRYELRVCWSAVQPTAFKLAVYTIANVFDDPLLIQSLAKTIHRPDPKTPHSGKAEGSSRSTSTHESVLFLHVLAAADFYSPNKTLMLEPREVDVDLILDPYAGGIFPESLTYTAVYLVILAVVGWLVSKLIWLLIRPAQDTKAHVD